MANDEGERYENEGRCPVCGEYVEDVTKCCRDEIASAKPEKKVYMEPFTDPDTGEVLHRRVAKPEKSNPMRVACDRHNEFRPVYITGRPLLDDRCPWCRIEELEKRK